MKDTVLFQNQPVVELIEGDCRLLASPNHGARLLTWQRGGREIIRWPADADWTKILKVRGGNPVLFPFLGRHFVDGKNEFWRDTSGTVRPMPQHGFCRDAKFEVIEQTPTLLRMRITDDDETRAFYPFAFEFEVALELLSGSRLEIRYVTTNKGAEPLPYYAGHHFYFAIPQAERADWILDLPCASWARQSSDGAIVHGMATTAHLNLADPAIIDRFAVKPTSDRATLTNTRDGRALTIEMPGPIPWYAVTTWTEKPDSDFYCIEPWLGLPNAIHHGEGLHLVPSGATETAICVLDASMW